MVYKCAAEIALRFAFMADESQKLVCAMVVSKYVKGDDNIAANRKREFAEYPWDSTTWALDLRCAKFPK